MQNGDFELQEEDPEQPVYLLYFKKNINPNSLPTSSTSPTIEQIYLDQAKEIANKLKESLNHFIRKNCYNEVSNFIIHLPKALPINLDPNLGLYDIKGNHHLSFSKIKKILEDPKNKILYPAVIAVAIKLNIGNFKATYEVERFGFASYECKNGLIGNSIQDVMCLNIFKYPSVRYTVNLSYEIPELRLIIPLITLYFLSELQAKYSLISNNNNAFMEQHIQQSAKYVHEINTKPIKELKFFWDHSILIKKEHVNYSNLKINLEQLHYHVVDYILKNNCQECKNIKKSLLESNYNFYASKLTQILKKYQSILLYAQLIGLGQDIINILSSYFDSKTFTNDLIDLPLIESHEGNMTEFTLLFKYINGINEAILHLEMLSEIKSYKVRKTNFISNFCNVSNVHEELYFAPRFDNVALSSATLLREEKDVASSSNQMATKANYKFN